MLIPLPDSIRLIPADQVQRPTKTTITKYKERILKHRDRRQAISDLKLHMPIEHFQDLLAELSRFPFFQDIYAPCAFPRSYNQIKIGALSAVGSLEIELAWTAAVLKQFESTLTRFIDLQEQFTAKRLIGAFNDADEILVKIEEEFGLSYWLIENKIGILQERDGVEAQKAYRNSVYALSGESRFTIYFTHFLSFKMEPTVSSNRYHKTIELELDRIKSNKIRNYISFRLSPLTELELSDYPHALGYEETSSIIDRYLSFIATCQHICAYKASRQNFGVLNHVANALTISNLDVKDQRLENLKWICSIKLNQKKSIGFDSALEVFDNYTKGKYLEAVQGALSLLKIQPARFDVVEILARSACRLSPDHLEQIGLNLHLPLNTLISDIATSFMSIILRDANYHISIEYLNKASQALGGISTASKIESFLERSTAHRYVTGTTSKGILSSLNCSIINPWQYPSFSKIVASGAAVQRLLSAFPKCDSIQLQSALFISDTDPHQAKSILDSIDLPNDRRDFYQARILEKMGEYDSVINIYQKWVTCNCRPVRYDAMMRLAWIYLEAGRFAECAELIADAYLENEKIQSSLPLAEILDCIENTRRKTKYDQINISILYDIYSKHIENDRDGLRSDAYEDALTSYDVERPSELRSKLDLSLLEKNRHKLLYYLEHICVPRIMDASTAFSGSKDLLIERISVCQWLSELNQARAQEFADEIRNLTQQILVGEGVQHVEQSRIYVDTAAVRSELNKTLPESFKRYIVLLSNKALDQEYRLLIRQAMKVALERSATVLLQLPPNERDELFVAMTREFGHHFVNSPVHGLATYLSGRIRHGILPNHLRSPLEINRLATQKIAKSSEYRPNEYWPEQLPNLSFLHKKFLGERLARFTSQIDDLINVVNGKWIHVRRPGFEDGLFDFSISPSETAALMDTIQVNTSYDEFLDRMFDFFWGLTDKNLTYVRSKIGGELRSKIIEAFDSLDADLVEQLPTEHITKLQGALAKARTDMQITIDRVTNWFGLSKATVKQDFDLSTLMNIAIQSTNNCFRHTPLSVDVNVLSDQMLKGETLSSFVELLYVFLSNVVRHSNIEKGPPVTSASVSLNGDGRLSIKISNKVEFQNSDDREQAQNKIDSAKRLVTGVDASSVTDREGGTGYAKVWKIVTHDLQCPFELDFGLDDQNEFKVDLSIDVKKKMA
jgi:hypothetical protein